MMNKFDKIYRFSSNFNKLTKAAFVNLQAGFSPPAGYKRMTEGNVSKKLQNISKDILSKYRNQPFGTMVYFNYAGNNYIALIEQHAPGPRNPVPHPGVSLLINEKSFKLSNRSLKMIANLNPEFGEKVKKMLIIGHEQGLRPEIVEGLRSQERQEQLYNQGRMSPGNIVTWTRNSMHTKGEAVDIAQLDENGKITYNVSPDFWNQMGNIGKSLGLIWGGDWKTPDRPHFQLKK